MVALEKTPSGLEGVESLAEGSMARLGASTDILTSSTGAPPEGPSNAAC